MAAILFSIVRWLVFLGGLVGILSRGPEFLWPSVATAVGMAFLLRIFIRRPDRAVMIPAAAVTFGYAIGVIIEARYILLQVASGVLDRDHTEGVLDGMKYEGLAMTSLSCVSILSMIAIWLLVKPRAFARFFATLVAGLFAVKYFIEMRELQMWDRGPLTTDIMFLLLIVALLLLGTVGQMLIRKEDLPKA